jgi:hypothetical protein
MNIIKSLFAFIVMLVATLFTASHAQAFALGNHAGGFFLGTLDCTEVNKPSTRNLCRENGWLNYDTLSGCSVATNKVKTASPGDFTRTHGLSGRASSRNVRNIAEDMKANGYQGAPIKVLEANGERFILDGHHRVQAARRAGIDVPFESISPSNLSNFGYNSVDDVIRASTEAGPVKLRP